ncbi:MAG TPA: hypothetical protein VHT92_03735 [Candidatus Cybelea sp.]|nr:hypothetical protein [Candidatus Cybelea sp.]
MIFLLAAAATVAAAVVAELVLPGRLVYHAGWYNVTLAALVVVTFAAGRGCYRRAQTARGRIAALAVVAGTAFAGFAGVTSGLFAPDNSTYAGVPGQRVRVESLGTLVFPLASADDSELGSVSLERPPRSTLALGDRRRDIGGFIVRTVERGVVYVEARDLRGNRLTVTQPSGSVFLSPVLLMQHRQTIAGLDVPFDSFNVPAMRRIVKAIAFTPAQAAMMLHGGAMPGESAVLFAVDDDKDRPLRNAIALSAGGRAVRIGGLVLRGSAASYPAVEVVAAPNLLVVIFGLLLVLGGAVALFSGPRRSPARS